MWSCGMSQTLTTQARQLYSSFAVLVLGHGNLKSVDQNGAGILNFLAPYSTVQHSGRLPWNGLG